MNLYKYASCLAVLASLVISQNPSTFWSDYPPCEEQCHESVWSSQQCSLANACGCGLDENCLCLADQCLCQTSSWLIAVAQCIGQNCGATAVTDAASIAASACAGNDFALAVPSSSLVSIGLAALPGTSQASTSPIQPTSCEPRTVLVHIS